MTPDELTLDIAQEIDIKADIAHVFEGLIKRLGENNVAPGDNPMPMRLEQKPGGRWFRDLGDGCGHLWGFVQVIKPPTLLELSGPMFMSYPVAGHLSLRLSEQNGTTRVSLRHRALGLIEPEHRQGVNEGWRYYLDGLKTDCQ